MTAGRLRMMASAYANTTFAAGTVVPFAATFEEGSPEGTPIGVLGMTNGYTGPLLFALVDGVGGRVKVVDLGGGEYQLQVGATPTVFATNPTLAPVVRATAGINGGVGQAGKNATISITVTEIGVTPTTGMLPSALYVATGGSGWAPGTLPVSTNITTNTVSTGTLHFLDVTDVQISDGHKFRVRSEIDTAAVYAMFEGNEYLSTGQTVRTIPNPRGVGSDVKMICHEFTANRSELVDGIYHIYFRHVSLDAAKPDRIIGPYTFHKKTGAYAGGMFDADVTINPDLPATPGPTGNFQYIRRLAIWMRTAPAANVHFVRATHTKTGNYEFNDGGGTLDRITRRGRIQMVAAPGITATYGSAAGGTVTSGFDFHMLGDGMVFDQAKIQSIPTRGEGSKDPLGNVLEGVQFYNSDGPFPLFNGDGYNSSAWGDLRAVIGCDVYDLGTMPLGLRLLRHCAITRVPGHLTQKNKCTVHNVVYDCTSRPYREHTPALSISCSLPGGGTWAKYLADGSVGGSVGGTLNDLGMFIRLTDVATGATQDFPVNGGNLRTPGLAAAISARPGWSASDIPRDVPYRSAALSYDGSARGGTWSPKPVGSAPVIATTALDLHVNFYQSQSAQQNIIIANNVVFNVHGTMLRIDSSALHNSCYYGDNFFHQDLSYESYPGLFLSASNKAGVVIDGNTFSNCNLDLDDLPTNVNCEIYGNVATSATSTAKSDQRLNRNHIMNGSTGSTAASPSLNVTSGGSMATLFVDAPNGDGTPQAELLSNLIPHRSPYDVNCDLRAANDARGAVRAA